MITPALREPGTTGWNTGSLDVDAYLRRVGHPRASPSAESLRTLHEAHVRTIPFENIDVLLGAHPGLELDVIAGKLVGRQRGGYCYEHSLLFAAVLVELGFTVERRMGRVHPQGSGPRTHMLSTVYVDGAAYQADVGFGAGVLRPMPLRDGAVVDQAGWAHRIDRDGPLWTLSRREPGDGGWTVLHASDEAPQRPVDYEVAHHYVSTHPHSPFVGKLVVMRLADGVSRQLVGDELTVTRPDGDLHRQRVPADRLDSALRDLGVVLQPAELEGVLAAYPSGAPG
ncbi:arylamine N-acetyltransferase [Amycolatopsis antarctica]|uniref:Arylamine N-acetyltransferase n=1 Tax=Amycolatopsis antarctica TaxID=1854586 RepID=A0A263CWV5_9PSEU|nr:arylamine N-acetyltransferase [Amycolatopsis antarctica]OZM70438.1 arylamine N-acetyltransferase [Amycolatopsis antarctica]